MAEAQWFALVVKPRHEKAVHSTLRGKGVDAFLPLYSQKRQWADRKADVTFPLFPGYVFGRFEAGSRSLVLATPGLFDIVRCGKEPAPIPDEQVQALQIAVNCGQPVEPWPHLAVGELVEMNGGPLSGLTGQVLEIKNSARLVLSVNLLNRSILIDIERKWIRPLPSKSPTLAQLPFRSLALQHLS